MKGKREIRDRRSKPGIAKEEEEVRSIQIAKREGEVEDRAEKSCEGRRVLAGVSLRRRREVRRMGQRKRGSSGSKRGKRLFEIERRRIVRYHSKRKGSNAYKSFDDASSIRIERD